MGKRKGAKGKKKAAKIKDKPKKAKEPDKQQTSATNFFLAVRVLKKVAKKPIEVSPQNVREALAKSPHAVATAAGKAAVLNALRLLREDLLHVLVDAGAVTPASEAAAAEGGGEEASTATASASSLILSPDGAVRAYLAKSAALRYNQLNELLRDASSAEAVKTLLDAGALPNYFGRYGCTAVHEAAYCGRTVCLFTLLQRGGLSFTRSAEGRTPLHAAAIGGNKHCVEVLIKAGVNVKAEDYCDMTALHFAAGSARSAACVPLLMAAGANVNAKDKFDMTPLHYAAASGAAETVKLLLDEGADRDASDQWHRTPGHLVYAECDTRERKEARAPIYWLLNPQGGGDEQMWENVEEDYFWDEEPPLPTSGNWEHDINVLRQLACFGDVTLQEMKTLLNRSPLLVSSFSACKALQTCAEIGRLEIINLFLKKGASPHIRESEFCSDEVFEPFVDPGYLTSSHTDWPLIHIAAAAGQVQTVETLLAAKASKKRVWVAEYADPFGPLEAAAANGHLAMVKYLLYSGCVTDREQLDGALRLAVTPECWEIDRKDWSEEMQTKIARTLLDAGADPNAQDVFGHTPGLGAAYCGWAKCLSLLIRRGSNVKIETPNGKTALHAAAGGRHTSCVSLLIKAGANVSSKDCLGQTPLHYVAEGLTQSERARAQCLKDDGAETVKALVNAGADINCHDKNGATPLHLAAKSGSIAVVEALLNCGALINAKDRNSRTPLYYATIARADDVVDKLTKLGADTNAKDCRESLPKSDAELNSVPLLRTDVKRNLENEEGDSSECSWSGISSDDEWDEESSADDTDDWELEYYQWVKELCKDSSDTKLGDEFVGNRLEQYVEAKAKEGLKEQLVQNLLLKSIGDVQTDSEVDGESGDDDEIEDIGKTVENLEKIRKLRIKWRLRGYIDSDSDFESLLDEDVQRTYLPPGSVSGCPKASKYIRQWIKGSKSLHEDQKPIKVEPQNTDISQQPVCQTYGKVDSKLKVSSPSMNDPSRREKDETTKQTNECKGQSNFVFDTQVPLVKQERDSERNETIKDETEECAEELRIKVELNDDVEEDTRDEQNIPYVSGAWTIPQGSETYMKEEKDWWNETDPESWVGEGSPHDLGQPDESYAAYGRPEDNSSSSLVGREEGMEYGNKRRSNVWCRLGKRSSDGDSDSHHNSIIVTRILNENSEEALRYVQENSLDEREARREQEWEDGSQACGRQSRLVRESNEWEQYQGQELAASDLEESYGHSDWNRKGPTHQQDENFASTERWVRESYESSERHVYVEDPSDSCEMRDKRSEYEGENRGKRPTERGWCNEESSYELQTGARSNSFEVQGRSLGRERCYSGFTDEDYVRERLESPGEGRREFGVEEERGQGNRNVQTRYEENTSNTKKMQDTFRCHQQGEAREKDHDGEAEGSRMSLRTQGDDWKESHQHVGLNRDWSHGSDNQRSDISPARSDWERRDLMGRLQRQKRPSSHEREIFEHRLQSGFGDRHNRCKRVSEGRENENFEYEDQLRKQQLDCHRRQLAHKNEASCSTPREYEHDQYKKFGDGDRDDYHFQARSNEEGRDRYHNEYRLSEKDCMRSYSQCNEQEKNVLNRHGEPMEQDRLQSQYRIADEDDPRKLLHVQERYLSRERVHERACSPYDRNDERGQEQLMERARDRFGSQYSENQKTQGRLEETPFGRSQSPNRKYDAPEHCRSTCYGREPHDKNSQTRGHVQGSPSQGRLEKFTYRRSQSPNSRFDEQECYRLSYARQEPEKDGQTRGCADEESHSRSRLEECAFRSSQSPNSRFDERECYRPSYARQDGQTRRCADEESHRRSRLEEHGFRSSQSPNSRFDERECYRPSYARQEHEKDGQTRGCGDEESHSRSRLEEHGFRSSQSSNSRYNEQDHFRSFNYSRQEHEGDNRQTRGHAYERSYSQGRSEEQAYERSQTTNSRYDKREHYRPTGYNRQEREKNRELADDGSHSRFSEREFGGRSELVRDRSGSRYSDQEREKFRSHYTSRKRSHSRSHSPLGRFDHREYERSGREIGRPDRKLYDEYRLRECARDRSRSPRRRVGDDLQGMIQENKSVEAIHDRSRIQYRGSCERGFRKSQTQHGWPDILKDVPH